MTYILSNPTPRLHFRSSLGAFTRNMFFSLMAWMITAGLLLLSFPPFGAFWLVWIAFIPSMLLTLSDTPMLELGIGSWVGGLLFFAAGLFFMADPTLTSSLVRWFLLAEVIAIQWPLGALLSRWLIRRDLSIIIVFPIVWTALEYFRLYFGMGFSLNAGFPWLEIGSTQIDCLSLCQVVDLGGIQLLSFTILFVNACVTSTIFKILNCRMKPISFSLSIPMLSSLILICLFQLYGRHRLETSQSDRVVRVGLVATDFDEETDLKAAERVRESIRSKTQLPEHNTERADFWLWPENSTDEPWVTISDSATELDAPKGVGIPERNWAEWLRLSKDVPNRVLHAAIQLDRPIVLGVKHYEIARSDFKRFVASTAIDVDGRILGFHHKRYLVPWSEFTPYGLLRSLSEYPNHLSKTDIDHGADSSIFSIPIKDTNELIFIATPICYEICFSRAVRLFFEQPNMKPDILCNLSREPSEFGSAFPRLMLNHSRFRAIETRTPIVRVVVDGYCAVIDSCGRILSCHDSRNQLPAERAQIWEVPLSVRSSAYSVSRDFPAILCATALIGLFLLGSMRSRKGRATCE